MESLLLALEELELGKVEREEFNVGGSCASICGASFSLEISTCTPFGISYHFQLASSSKRIFLLMITLPLIGLYDLCALG